MFRGVKTKNWGVKVTVFVQGLEWAGVTLSRKTLILFVWCLLKLGVIYKVVLFPIWSYGVPSDRKCCF